MTFEKYFNDRYELRLKNLSDTLLKEEVKVNLLKKDSIRNFAEFLRKAINSFHDNTKLHLITLTHPKEEFIFKIKAEYICSKLEGKISQFLFKAMDDTHRKSRDRQKESHS